MNARFVFLASGECPTYSGDDTVQPSNCWSHPGSYFGQLSFITNNGDQIMIQAGNGNEGFNKIMINNETIITEKKEKFPITITGHAKVNNNVDNNTQHCSSPFIMTLHDFHHLSLSYSLWTMEIDNSDMFLNLASVSVSSWSTLVQSVQPHGLLGQTWRILRGNDRGEEVSSIVGRVDDYLEANNDMYGVSTLYNKFHSVN